MTASTLRALPGARGFVTFGPTGPLEVLPSRRDWKKVRCYWRCKGPTGAWLSPYRPTPQLALAAALSRAAGASKHGAVAVR